jgi:hypothetical protein
MKKTTTIVALALLFAGAVFAQNNTPVLEIDEQVSVQKDTAIIKFAKASHPFGDIVVGVQAKTSFEYTNEGNVPLVLTNVRPSCGCTAPNWSREPLMPGETGVINVTFYSSGKAGQNFNKSITVTSNAAPVTLYIRGKVLAKTAEPVSPVKIRN